MSAFTRVKKLLTQIGKRQSQSDFAKQKKKRGRHVQIAGSNGRVAEEIAIKATGKAIDQALQLGLHLQKQNDLSVKIKTGSVAAIDDIVQSDTQQVAEEHEELPESRIRHTSMIEVRVMLAT